MISLTSRQRRFDLREWRRRTTAKALGRWLRGVDQSFRADGALDTARIRRILICRPNHRLGNALLLTPLVAELARILPQARVDIVIGGDAAREIFQEFPNVQAVHVLPTRPIRHPLALLRTLRRLRRGYYDLAIDPCDASQSGRALVVLSRAPQAIGLPNAGAAGIAQRACLMRDAPAHFAQLPIFLLRNALPLGLASDALSYPALDIVLSADERTAARRVLNQVLQTQGQSNPVCLGIFAGATGDKRFTGSWWTQFLAGVRQRHPHWSILEILPPGKRSPIAANLPNYASSSVRNVAAMISCVSAFVCADSGVMHLANASGTMTLGLFSVTDPRKYAPYGNGSLGLDTRELTPDQIACRVAETIAASLARSDGTTGHDRIPEQPA